jgi:hypothetical protein
VRSHITLEPISPPVVFPLGKLTIPAFQLLQRQYIGKYEGISDDVIGWKKMKSGKKSGNVKEKGRKGKEKGRREKEKEKNGSKREK